MTGESNRREFLERFGLGAAGVITAGYAATSFGFPANETINIAAIGTGGRCRHLLGAFKDLPGVRLTALCDVWDQSIEASRKYAVEKPFETKEFREILDRKDIDAVLIATPDHWHVPITIAACEAGKDVYVEKPLTHKLSEGQAVIDAQNHNKRIVQVGMQQRSMPQYQKGSELVKSGKLGKVHKVHLTWNRNAGRDRSRPTVDPTTVDWKRFLGNAPDQPFDAFRFRHWRWFWDFGGGLLTDLMVHQIDIANWFLDITNPATAVTIGDHFHAEGLWQTPDTIQTLLQYPDQELQIYYEGTFSNARRGAMIELMGTDASLYVDRGRYELHPEPGRKEKYEEWVLDPNKPRGADFYDNPNGELLHLANWIECIRSRKTPNAPAEAGVAAVLGAHLGNQAYRTGQTAKWTENASQRS